MIRSVVSKSSPRRKTQPESKTHWLELSILVTKAASAVAELDPFPFAKGISNIVLFFLETLQNTKNNDEDALRLGEELFQILVIVRDIAITQDQPLSGRLQSYCTEFQSYLSMLIGELDELKRNSKGFRRFLQSEAVKQRIQDYRSKAERLRSTLQVQVTLDTAITTGQLQCTLNSVKNDSSRIFSILRQSVRRNKAETEIHTFIPADLSLMNDVHFPSPQGGVHVVRRRKNAMHYHGITGNSSSVKTIRVYRSGTQKRWKADLDFYLKFRHPHLPQLYGICKSEALPALVFHNRWIMDYDEFEDAQQPLARLKLKLKRYRTQLSVSCYLVDTGMIFDLGIHNGDASFMIDDTEKVLIFPHRLNPNVTIHNYAAHPISIFQAAGIDQWDYELPFEREGLPHLYEILMGYTSYYSLVNSWRRWEGDSLQEFVESMWPDTNGPAVQFTRYLLLDLWRQTDFGEPDYWDGSTGWPAVNMGNGILRVEINRSQLGTRDEDTATFYCNSSDDTWTQASFAVSPALDEPVVCDMKVIVKLRVEDPVSILSDSFMNDSGSMAELETFYLFIRPCDSNDNFWIRGYLSFDPLGIFDDTTEIEELCGIKLDAKIVIECARIPPSDIQLISAVHQACGFDPRTTEAAEALDLPLCRNLRHVRDVFEDPVFDNESPGSGMELDSNAGDSLTVSGTTEMETLIVNGEKGYAETVLLIVVPIIFVLLAIFLAVLLR